jgi:anti-anti-sigma regulatory factor
MLRIQRLANEKTVEKMVFRLSGRMDAEDIATLQSQFESEGDGRRTVLDLTDLTLLDRDAVRFLERCEADAIELTNCRAYIREWIERERERRVLKSAGSRPLRRKEPE